MKPAKPGTTQRGLEKKCRPTPVSALKKFNNEPSGEKFGQKARKKIKKAGEKTVTCWGGVRQGWTVAAANVAKKRPPWAGKHWTGVNTRRKERDIGRRPGVGQETRRVGSGAEGGGESCECKESDGDNQQKRSPIGRKSLCSRTLEGKIRRGDDKKGNTIRNSNQKHKWGTPHRGKGKKGTYVRPGLNTDRGEGGVCAGVCIEKTRSQSSVISHRNRP